jgi:hypothetical protein
MPLKFVGSQMDNENSLESILPKEVVEKIASAVTVQLSGAAIGKAAHTGTLTVGAAATAESMAEVVIRALPSSAESKKLWDSQSGTLIINLIAMIVIAFYAEHGADVRQRSSDESMKRLTELVAKIAELLQTHTEKAPPPPSNGGD